MVLLGFNAWVSVKPEGYVSSLGMFGVNDHRERFIISMCGE